LAYQIIVAPGKMPDKMDGDMPQKVTTPWTLIATILVCLALAVVGLASYAGDSAPFRSVDKILLAVLPFWWLFEVVGIGGLLSLWLFTKRSK
jgi:hypothetical protein